MVKIFKYIFSEMYTCSCALNQCCKNFLCEFTHVNFSVVCKNGMNTDFLNAKFILLNFKLRSAIFPAVWKTLKLKCKNATYRNFMLVYAIILLDSAIFDLKICI